MAIGMTFWDFIYKLSHTTKILIATFIGLFCTVSVYVYKYIPDLKSWTWYFEISMMLFIVVVYYLLFIVWTWIYIKIMDWEKDINTAEIKLSFFGITAFIEAVIFAGIAYLFIESPRTFWLWFFGLQLYRIIFLGIIRICMLLK